MGRSAKFRAFCGGTGGEKETERIDLYAAADENGVEIICTTLAHNVSVSTMTHSGSCYIGIDPMQINTSAEETTHIAHELGHCVTGSFYNVHAALDIRAKHERRADKWAIKKLIPADELHKAFSRGIVEAWELAEYFNVTEDFIRKAYAYYENNNML